MWGMRRAAASLVPRWRHSSRAIATSRCVRQDNDPLSALFEEMDSVDTSPQPRASTASSKSSTVAASPEPPAASPPKAPDDRVRVEESKQRRLRRQLRDASEELSALLEEQSRVATAEAGKSYLPAGAAKTFLSSAELIQEKAPQEFVASERSAEEVAAAPLLQHSGCAAVVTMVGVVTEAPRDATFTVPGGNGQSSCVEFTVKYDVPFMEASTAMLLSVRAVGATLSAFTKENVGVGDVVHVLGHLAPLSATGSSAAVSCAVYVLPVGGNIAVVLSKRKVRGEEKR